MANAGFGPHPPKGSYRSVKAVTPNNATDLPDGPCRALWLATTGNVSFITVDGDTVPLLSVAAHAELPFCVARVLSTGTTATVLALY